MNVEELPKLTPADVTRALDLWRRFANQHGLNLGDPDRVVYLASRLNEALAKRATAMGGSTRTNATTRNDG